MHNAMFGGEEQVLECSGGKTHILTHTFKSQVNNVLLCRTDMCGVCVCKGERGGGVRKVSSILRSLEVSRFLIASLSGGSF